MGTHPTFSSAGPNAPYQPRTRDVGDDSIGGSVVPFVEAIGSAGAKIAEQDTLLALTNAVGKGDNTATPDIGAGGSPSFTVVSLLKGCVANLLAMKAKIVSGTLNVQTPAPQAWAARQVKIAVNNTPVQLPDVALLNGVTIKAANTNQVQFFQSTNYSAVIGNGSNVVALFDGDKNAWPIEPGESITIATNNMSNIWINGAAGDKFAIIGN